MARVRVVVMMVVALTFLTVLGAQEAKADQPGETWVTVQCS